MRKNLIYAVPLLLGIIVAIILWLTPGVLPPDPARFPIYLGYLSIGIGIALSLAMLGMRVVLNRQGRRWDEANRQIQIDAEQRIADAQAAADSRASGQEVQLRQQIAGLKQQTAELQARAEQAQLAARSQTARLSDQSTEAVRQAEHKATKARHEFYERLDHEVKQPLQRLQSAADNLYRSVGITQGEPKNYYLRMTNEIKQVDSMIEDLRQLAVMASDKQPFAPERLSLGELLSKIVSDVKSNDPRAATRDIQLNLPDFPELPPPDILGEPDNLARVFRNLLDNAIKYTEENGKIRVKVYAPKQRDKVIVEVIDNGRGIPANELEQVWEELYRASNAGNEGSGMGLALVRIAIERHGGERSIERLEPPQSGTRVILSFPAVSAAADAHQPDADRAAKPSTQESAAPASAPPPAQPLEDAIGDTPRSRAES
jgi:two-component system, OmpR family, sensor kinase